HRGEDVGLRAIHADDLVPNGRIGRTRLEERPRPLEACTGDEAKRLEHGEVDESVRREKLLLGGVAIRESGSLLELEGGSDGLVGEDSIGRKLEHRWGRALGVEDEAARLVVPRGAAVESAHLGTDPAQGKGEVES